VNGSLLCYVAAPDGVSIELDAVLIEPTPQWKETRCVREPPR
jgi:hypothetical protein